MHTVFNTEVSLKYILENLESNKQNISVADKNPYFKEINE